MTQKAGRFNYLANNHASPERIQESERFQYKQIIDQLTREHQFQNHLKEAYRNQLETKEKRVCSPVRNVVQAKGKQEKGSNQIKSIILNQTIQTDRANPEKSDSKPKGELKDAYRFIKESHIMNDDQIDKMCEQFQSQPSVQRNNPKPKQPAHPQKVQTPIRFYEIKPEEAKLSRSKTPQKKKSLTKNNQPYINQVLKGYPLQEKRNEYPTFSPSRIVMSQSQLKRTNLAYKAKIIPQRPQWPQWQYQQPPVNQPQKIQARKRSCYDYVPAQLKSKLSKVRSQY